MPKTGPYIHWVEGDIVIKMEGLRCSGKSPADAKARMRKTARDMDGLLRRYWQIGPRSKDLTTEVFFQESRPE